MRCTENKRDIAGRLSLLLRATKAGEGMERLLLSEDEQTVTIVFQDGHQRDVNVACDSGIAMVRDVISALE